MGRSRPMTLATCRMTVSLTQRLSCGDLVQWVLLSGPTTGAAAVSSMAGRSAVSLAPGFKGPNRRGEVFLA